MNNATSLRQTLMTRALILATAGASGTAMAATLEEVIVTAQKRAESLQDVPISVSVLKGEKITQAGMQKLQDAMVYIPNVSIAQQYVGNSINIRGIHSGTLAAFEQSVGTFADGVYRGRGVQSRFAFLDVSMLEVLRGPQGTLFGKNVIAGALNITSAKPKADFEGSITATENITFEETELTGYITGALSNTVRARFAFLDRTMDKGWLKNVRYGTDEPVKDEQAYRILLEWNLSDDTLVSFKHEDTKWDNAGFPLEHIALGPLIAYANLGTDGSVDGNTAIGSFPQNPDPVQELYASQIFQGDSNETVLTVEHSIDQGLFTMIASNSEYDFHRATDADYSIADLANFVETEGFQQNTFELRFASNQEGAIEYVTGLYYSDADLSIGGNSQFNLKTIADGTKDACHAGHGTQLDYHPSSDKPHAVFETVASINSHTSAKTTNSCGIASLAAPSAEADIKGFNRFSLLKQNSETWAVFGQFTWHINDNLRSTFGLRYTEQVKEADSSSVVADYGRTNETSTSNNKIVGVAELVGEFVPHSFEDLSRDEESLTWSANLQYDVDDETMLYGSISTGFKAGGFNSLYFDLTPTADEIDFDNEEAITIELGAKMSLLDDSGEVNLAVFRTEFNDLQVSVFSGATTMNVTNAAKATTQGVEINSRWQISDQLLVSAAAGLIDFEYDKYANQACTDHQFNTWREANWALNPMAAFTNTGDCAAAGINDLSGKTAAQTPEISASLSAAYNMPVGAHLDMDLVLDLNYRDDVYRQDDLDEHTFDDAATYVNASVNLASVTNSWVVTLRGNNLTDVESYDMGIDVPLASGAHVVLVSPPRSYSLGVSYKL
ncbi:MAG: TonB-dependent receptor [Porticoccaceae bacterium]